MKILNASATQTDGDNGKSDWQINTDCGINIYTLDSKMNEKQVMEAIHMARKFAKDGLEKGLQLADNKHKLNVENIMANGQKQLDMLNERIAGLSGELLRYMEEDE